MESAKRIFCLYSCSRYSVIVEKCWKYYKLLIECQNKMENKNNNSSNSGGTDCQLCYRLSKLRLSSGKMR